MNLRPRATSIPVLQVLVLLPLLLLLTALVPSTIGEISILAESVEDERYAELRCLCLKTTSGIHPSNIRSLKVIRAGAHCSNVEVIATLKNGNEACLDPDAPRIKNIVQKILEGEGPAAQSLHSLSNLYTSQDE